MSWLDQFLLAVRSVASSGTALPQRGTLNFTGAGVAVVDDEANDATVITVAGGAGITALTGDVTASGSGSVAATVARLQGRSVASTAPTDGQVLTYSASGSQWLPVTPGGGTPTSVVVTFTAGEAAGISAGDPLYVSESDGYVYRSRANNTATRNVIGVALNNYAQGATASVLLAGLGTPYNLNPTFGRNYYVGDSGGLAPSYAVGSGSMLILVGVGYSGSQLCVSIRDYGVKP